MKLILFTLLLPQLALTAPAGDLPALRHTLNEILSASQHIQAGLKSRRAKSEMCFLLGSVERRYQELQEQIERIAQRSNQLAQEMRLLVLGAPASAQAQLSAKRAEQESLNRLGELLTGLEVSTELARGFCEEKELDDGEKINARVVFDELEKNGRKIAPLQYQLASWGTTAERD